MNLGIHGRQAIVCAASKGLGKACAVALAREGVNLVINARTADALATPRRRFGAKQLFGSPRLPATLLPTRDVLRSLPRVRTRTYWSTTPVVRRLETFANGVATS